MQFSFDLMEVKLVLMFVGLIMSTNVALILVGLGLHIDSGQLWASRWN